MPMCQLLNIRVPEDIIEEATSADGPEVSSEEEVTAQDDVDGTATLDENNILTQDDVGGSITIICDPPSGSTFLIGSTEIQCIATDEAGNTGTASFMITVAITCEGEIATIVGTSGDDEIETEGWAGSELNQRPPPCQGGILTRLDHRPNIQ